MRYIHTLPKKQPIIVKRPVTVAKQPVTIDKPTKSVVHVNTRMNQFTFDWSLTNRKLVVFIPCRGRGQYLRRSIELDRTTASCNDWIYLVVNDGIHEDFSDLADKNVVYFTFEHNNGERNSIFIRNYIFKRVQSQLVFSRDDDCVTNYDYISHALNTDGFTLYRAGYFARFDKNETLSILGGRDLLGHIHHHKFTLSRCSLQGSDAKKSLGFHAGFCINPVLLRFIRGYDEDYRTWGRGDRDCYLRLLELGIKFDIDYKYIAYHLWHQLNPYAKLDNVCMEKYSTHNEDMFDNEKTPTDIIRNIGREWGDG